MNTILVTGGSGFVGRCLIQKLLDKYGDLKIRTISRNETEIRVMLTACDSDRLEYVVGDIRDVDALKYALKGVRTVIHLAAMKHIDFCERHPSEAFTINVIGSVNLLKYFAGDTFIAMSTDKAVEATNCYGATKLLMEKLVLGKAMEDEFRRYMVMRSGNIYGSSGSVVDKWKQQISEKNEITITDVGMTRFFVGVGILSDYIINVMEKGETGNIYVPFQKAIKLGDLAKAIIRMYGNKDTKIRVIGVRKGDKLHEKLFTTESNIVSDLKTNCSQDAEEYTFEEIQSQRQP